MGVFAFPGNGNLLLASLGRAALCHGLTIRQAVRRIRDLGIGDVFRHRAVLEPRQIAARRLPGMDGDKPVALTAFKVSDGMESRGMRRGALLLGRGRRFLFRGRTMALADAARGHAAHRIVAVLDAIIELGLAIGQALL